MKDDTEREYERAIAIAASTGDNDEAYYLSVGLREYRRWYKS